MKITDLEEHNKRITFKLENSNNAFANYLRRTMLKGIPILAIEEVIIDENNSGLYDEILAHRLGLLPLKFDPTAFKFRDQCDCDHGCTQCESRLVLEKEGPCTLTASDIKTANPEVVIDNKDMIIAELLEGQKVKLEAVACLGTGKEHAKYQAAKVGYKYDPTITIYPDKCNNCKECIETCPVNIFVEKDGKVGTQYQDKCTLCNRCVELCSRDAILVSQDQNTFIFKVESICGLEPKKILELALKTIKEEANEFKKSL